MGDSADWDFEPEEEVIERTRSALWERWKRHRYLSIRQASNLLTGNEPTRKYISNIVTLKSKEADAMATLICQCIVAGELPAFQVFVWPEYVLDDQPDEIDSNNLRPSHNICEHRTVITTANLAAWAEREGIPHRWNTTKAQETTPELANKPTPTIPYTEELQAAIDAYEAVRGNPEATQGRTPRKALLSWLEENHPNLGAKARARIATMCNWEPKGGAPATPTGRGSE